MNRVLFLLMNSVCHDNCTYCFYTTGYQKRSSARVTPDISDVVARQIFEAGFQTVILTGGDPLHKKCKHETYILIEKLKKYIPKVMVNTSAASLEEKDLDTLISLGVDRIDISIDSYLPSVHNKQRGHHAEAVWAITNLIAKGYEAVATTTVLTEMSAITVKGTIKWLREIGVKDIRIQRVFLPNEEYQNDIITHFMYDGGKLLPAPHTKDYVELTERVWKNMSIPKGPVCQMGKRYFVCDSKGVLTTCFHCSDNVLGNLFYDSTEKILSAMAKTECRKKDLPDCFGRHCVSLFDNPNFWRNKQ